jgi:hypothetical protein
MEQGMVSSHGAGVAATQGAQMKRRNPVGVWLGLPLITLSIYHLVWYYKIHNELAQFDRRQTAIKPGGSMRVLLFLGWTVIAPLISYRNTARFVAEAQRAAGLPVTCKPAAAVWLMFVAGLGTLYLQGELNKVVAAYGDTAPGSVVALTA